MSKIKPCPFCGEVPILDKKPLWHNHAGTTRGYKDCYEYFIACKKCGCTLRYSYNDTVYRADKEAMSSVISLWNTRTKVMKSVDLHNTTRISGIKQAEWVVCGDGEYTPFVCTACKKTTTWYHKQTAKYCPNCGARMISNEKDAQVVKIIKNWNDLVGLESDKYTLDINLEMGCGRIIPKDPFSDEYRPYLSTHTFYGSCYKSYENVLRTHGFNVKLISWDEE